MASRICSGACAHRQWELVSPALQGRDIHSFSCIYVSGDGNIVNYIRRHVLYELIRIDTVENRVLAAFLIYGLMACTKSETERHLDGGKLTDEQNSRRVKGDILELAEWGEVVSAVFPSGADPSNWSRDDEALKRVVRETAIFTKW